MSTYTLREGFAAVETAQLSFSRAPVIDMGTMAYNTGVSTAYTQAEGNAGTLTFRERNGYRNVVELLGTPDGLECCQYQPQGLPCSDAHTNANAGTCPMLRRGEKWCVRNGVYTLPLL